VEKVEPVHAMFGKIIIKRAIKRTAGVDTAVDARSP